MNTVKYLKTFALLAATLLIASCAEEATTPSNGKSNQQEPNTKGLTAFVVEENDTKTRTTAEYFDNGGLNRGLHFYWTEGDRLWVNTGTSLSPVLKQDTGNNISAMLTPSPIVGGIQRAATAKFWFDGAFTANSYPVRYTGKNGTEDKVTISSFQYQSKANDAYRIGEYGDCGTAIAMKNGEQYEFKLQHKASYITFLPYTTQSYLDNAVVTHIKITAEKAVSGQFNFDDSGIDVDNSRPTATELNQSVDLWLNTQYSQEDGFPITSAPSKENCSAIMVVAPGTYSNFIVQYFLYVPAYNAYGSITKYYTNVTLTAGKNKKISQDLQATVYPGIGQYYMWDAQENYWYGHESEQPTIRNTYNSNYPKNNDPLRWYNETPYPASAVHSAKNCPNANEVAWYIRYGDPHWDNPLWITMGRVYANGIWIKKQSKIVADNPTLVTSIQDLKDKAPDGIDYTTSGTGMLYASNLSYKKITNPDDYFFLPAFGHFQNGTFLDIGSEGFYWPSTPVKQDGNRFYFHSGGVNMYHSSSPTRGFRLWSSSNEDMYKLDGLR